MSRFTLEPSNEGNVYVPDGAVGSSLRWTGVGWRGEYGFPEDGLRATGVLAETWPRHAVTSNAVGAATSQRLYMTPIWLPVGDMTTITMFSGATAMAGGSHVWFSLYTLDFDPVLLGVTDDDTAATWAANTKKSLDLATPVTIEEAGFYRAGRLIQATTMPSLCGLLSQSAINSELPVYRGGSTSGLTDPASAPDPAGELAGSAGTPYVAVS